ncbi:hypothetical protein, partial [Actinomadura sp. 7K507]|uniref:hypothetical protein n=1 Tax=Actinomadura sp. 7K507 TaxID=2530365 RepID=UPI0010E7853F
MGVGDGAGLVLRGVVSGTGALLGGAFVPACGPGSGSTYFPYVGSPAGVVAGAAFRTGSTPVPGPLSDESP